MAHQPGGANARPASVIAWDLPTRLFHWSLVSLMAATWATFEFSETLNDPDLAYHRWTGYAILVLVVWRLIWGFAGSSTSRFRNFVKGPSAALHYARALIAGTARRYLGHNPLGAWMVLALLALAGGQAILGLFTLEHNEVVAGPLYRFVSEETGKVLSRWHRIAFDTIILPVIVLHVAANVLYGVIKKDPLIPAMIKGTKPAEVYEDASSGNQSLPRPMLRAGLCLALAALTVFGPIVAVGGRI